MALASRVGASAALVLMGLVGLAIALAGLFTLARLRHPERLASPTTPPGIY